jgi:hypothetical protein
MSSDAAPTRRLSTPLIVVLAVAAAAALGYLAVVILNQGDGVGGVDETGSIVGSEPATVAPDAATEPDPQVSEGPTDDGPQEPSFEVFDARDPFDQLVAGASSGAVGDTQDTATTTPTSDGAQDTTTPGGVQDTTPTGGDSGQTTVGTTRIRLDDVFRDGDTDKVIVEVNGTGYEAAEGDTVAGDLTVLDIEGSCATMRFRDTRFILCEGEQIQK